jgi:hypothetical protein
MYGNTSLASLIFQVRVPTWDTDLDNNLGVSGPNGCTGVADDYVITDITDTPSTAEKEKAGDCNEKLVDTNLSVDDFDEVCCAGTSARPYNKDRNKSVTRRFVLEEVEQLRGEHEAIAQCVRQAMLALEVRLAARYR